MKCRTCDETDPDKFYNSERKRSSARCKECMKQYVRDRYNHDKMRDWHMRYNYNGFGVTDFNAMVLTGQHHSRAGRAILPIFIPCCSQPTYPGMPCANVILHLRYLIHSSLV